MPIRNEHEEFTLFMLEDFRVTVLLSLSVV